MWLGGPGRGWAAQLKLLASEPAVGIRGRDRGGHGAGPSGPRIGATRTPPHVDRGENFPHNQRNVALAERIRISGWKSSVGTHWPARRLSPSRARTTLASTEWDPADDHYRHSPRPGQSEPSSEVRGVRTNMRTTESKHAERGEKFRRIPEYAPFRERIRISRREMR